MVLTLPLGLGRWLVGLRWGTEGAAVLHHSAGAVGLVVAVCPVLGLPVLDQPPTAEAESLLACPRDRIFPLGPLCVEALLRLSQPGTAALAAGQVLGQLVAASLAVDLVLGSIDAAGFFEDLGGDLLIGADGAVARRGSEFGAVDGDHPDLDQSGLGAEAEDLAEEVSESLLVADSEAGDRGVVGSLVRADHPEGDVLAAAALDPSR